MYRWLLYKIPLILYGLVLLWMFYIHSASALVVMVVSLFIAVPWVVFAKYLCKCIDDSKKFNHRK